jgi:hypothetical protein
VSYFNVTTGELKASLLIPEMNRIHGMLSLQPSHNMPGEICRLLVWGNRHLCLLSLREEAKLDCEITYSLFGEFNDWIYAVEVVCLFVLIAATNQLDSFAFE